MNNGGKVPEEKPAFDTMDAIQRQQCFVDLVNPNEQMGFAGDDMMLPFGDANQNAIWGCQPFSLEYCCINGLMVLDYHF